MIQHYLVSTIAPDSLRIVACETKTIVINTRYVTPRSPLDSDFTEWHNRICPDVEMSLFLKGVNQ